MAKTHTIGGVQYREVARKAEVGEKIKIVDAGITFGAYRNGDVFTVKAQSPRGHCVIVDGTYTYIRHEEYVVLEPDVIVHEGRQYRKVDRPVRKGDVVLALVDEEDLVKGAVYEVSYVGGGGGIKVIDDAKDDHYLRADEYAVLEPVAPSPSALEAELAAAKAKVVELEAKLAEVLAQQKAGSPVERLKAGDHAVVLRAPGRLKIGDVVVITLENPDAFDFNAQRVLDGLTEVFNADELRRATDEEVAEAKRQRKLHEIEAKWAAIGRKVGAFKIGDVVRVVDAGSSSYEVGRVGVVTRADPVAIVLDGTTYRPFLDVNRAELVAPVESVVNLRGGDVV